MRVDNVEPQLEKSGTIGHLAPHKCPAVAAVFAGGRKQSSSDERGSRQRAPGPDVGREAGESAEPGNRCALAWRGLSERTGPRGQQRRSVHVVLIPLHSSAQPGRARRVCAQPQRGRADLCSARRAAPETRVRAETSPTEAPAARLRALAAALLAPAAVHPL
jgi:hypothetical protein